jgi:chloramphenicol 3-O phosphotransferase
VPATEVIVLNGASSSGKSSIAVQLQTLLPRPFLHVGADTMVDALPPSGGIDVDATGAVTVDETFRRLEHSWYEGLAAMARDGAGLIIDEVFLGVAAAQADVVHAGVQYDLEVDTSDRTASECAAAIVARCTF